MTSRAIAANAGINVPDGVVIQRGDSIAYSSPVVVKPSTADNSHGVSLVTRAKELARAIATAFEFSDQAIVESFVPLGREVRCGTISRDDQIECLPLQEYALDATTHPIRSEADKLTRHDDGALDLTSKHRTTSSMVNLEDPITEIVWSVARQCHRAFNCRDYGLFDFRIDPAGRVYFLEAGLYCSFAPSSIVSTMARASGIQLHELFRHCLEMAISRDTRPNRKRDDSRSFTRHAPLCLSSS
ncbi:MAG: hypothetical protein AAF745_05650 [Planctomycetota bacterium]